MFNQDHYYTVNRSPLTGFEPFKGKIKSWWHWISKPRSLVCPSPRRTTDTFKIAPEIKLAHEGFTPYCSSHEFDKTLDRWPPATKIRNN